MKQLRLSGSGGQGVITAAIIFAEAAMNEGKQVVQSQSYGPEARGGASKAEIVISDEKIYHPKIVSPDIVLSLTQKAADKYYKGLDQNNGLLVVDEDLVPNIPDFPNVVKVPVTRIAAEKVGKMLFTNIVALGVLVKLSQLISLESAKKAVEKRVPPHTIEQNMKALQLGYDAV
ncbi:2-oxoglutarate ferredoxin oxidoreductase subunit gamma [Pectinatus brassicae]|uniref:2-oxoglutarate ferredoxin oxidoreductase subunit gamma n=2 Tax=Pectinatus brassicae TaxID=862415 RepID=A0A840UJT9_9FIRM|nr:2-oxoacid:acceptor oxidoreductase family protein [Pectinatus brassicae]MBB5336450.1 2-oxoglutarate ferredoxin oxidoreductase subunit gamma [Pectinatus brassicae]